MRNRRFGYILSLIIVVIVSPLLSGNAGVAFADAGNLDLEPYDVPCRDHTVQAIVWSGNNPKMTIEQLAAYCGPILWFSPDEPLLAGNEGQEISLPEPFPFEETVTTPVVYYRIRTIVVREDADGPAYIPYAQNKNLGFIDLHQIIGIELDYFFYYHKEEGMGSHEHDVESVQFTLHAWRREDCPDCKYNLVVTRVVAKAHGIHWYDNILKVDEYAKFPMHILVEEGKHASCTDKNGDGYFTPGYDVNKRVNDAWGVRDVMRTGTLFTSSYQAWMTKLRREEHRVFPPLPEDSPLRESHLENGVYAPKNATYVLRPFPSTEAESNVHPYIAGKGDPRWPREKVYTDLTRLQRWVAEAGDFVKSLSIAFRADGDYGMSIIFPLFIVKHFQEPFGGGWIVNRIYFKDTDMRDFAWTVLYTASASRWMEGYLSAGFEWDEEWDDIYSPETFESNRNFVLETGVKFRANLTNTPLKFLNNLTDFWGLRLGIKSTGFVDIDRLTYVIEIGAGSW
ncbi:MAG: hypothetical protein JSV53_11855 [candidate division WOR-3 bacterium]|nr:MAG: hypothetical protein JSV53_11855 [candidate division WOR-3 bacterium]